MNVITKSVQLPASIRCTVKNLAVSQLRNELAEQFRGVAAIEKRHEERYRALLHNVEAQQVFAKSEVRIWECRKCGHIVVGTKAPEVCPICKNPQAYFEIHTINY